MNKKYEFLPHISDSMFRAYGSTLEQAFENSALAMMNVMIDTSSVSLVEKRKIEITSDELESLLVDWLSEIIFLFETEYLIFGDFKIDYIKDYSLKAVASGEYINLSRHSFVTHVKAITYHKLKIKKNKDFCIQVIVDT